MKKYNMALGILKVFSMFLIINSHIDSLYPDRLSFLASGGAIGNGLFFLLSGYFFTAGRTGVKQMARRFLRLYIPAYLVTFMLFATSGHLPQSFLDVIRIFVFPTWFYFVGAIFACSFIIHFLAHHANIEKAQSFAAFGVIIAALDILAWVFLVKDKSVWVVEDVIFFNGFLHYKCIYSLFIYVFGYWIKMNRERVLGLFRQGTCIFLALVSFVLFIAFKFSLNKGWFPMKAQILSQPLTILCVLFIFLSFVEWEIPESFSSSRLGKLAKELSGLTLESYLVQFVLIAWVAGLGLAFPLNVLLVFVVVLCVAWGLKTIDVWLAEKISHALFYENQESRGMRA